MNKAILQRFIHDKATFGKLTFTWLSNQPEIFTLELPFVNNQPNISCIPQGLYNIIPHNSTDHPDTYKLLSVPNRFNILIHNGNYLADIKGCILVGFRIDRGVPMVCSSVKAMNWMRDNIKGNWCLEVRNNLPPE